MGKDWGKVMVATRYQPSLPAYTCESFVALSKFGMRNAPDELVRYVESLEALIDQHGLEHDLQRPETYLRQGDVRETVYSKTMHKAANTLARKLLESDCDSICFIDSDAVFGSNALDELRNDPEGWEYDVLQAFTVKRGWPPEPMFLTRMPVQPEGEDHLRGVHLETNLPLDPAHIYPVDSVSLHFTLIRREVFVQLLQPEGARYTYWFEYSRDNGEDVTFSANARKVGARMGMTTRLKVGHVSEMVTGWDTMVDYYDRLYAYAEGEPVASMERVAKYFQAQHQLSELVAEYTGEEVELVYSKACSGIMPVHDQWKVKHPTTPDEVRHFYGNTPDYIYSLIKWNSTPSFQRILKQLRGVTCEKILEFGGGMGTTTEFLVTHGNAVDYYDLPGMLRDFAKWRLGRLNGFQKNIRFVEQWEIADDEGHGYDRIVAIDVLEHLHPDEFDFLCDGLLMGLKPGGVIVAHNNWEKKDAPYPSHFDHAAKWDAFVTRHGLIQEDDYIWRKPGKEQ